MELNKGQPLIGDGSTQIAVGDRDGKVILQFPTPIQWAALDPPNAVGIAKAMIDASVVCGLDVQITTPKRQVSEGEKLRMEVRTVMLLKNKRESKEKDEMLAKRIVENLLNMLEL